MSGALVLHLGALDESLIRQKDLYLCIRPATTEQQNQSITTDITPTLCAVWRCQITSKIIYHPLDPDKNPLSPIAIEMLAEDIPQLLQSLLVGVERAICRVSLEEFVFPSSSTSGGDDKSSSGNTSSSSSCDDTKTTIQQPSLNNIVSPNQTPKRSAECNLKRSKILNGKNSSIKRYSSVSTTQAKESEKNLKNETGNGGVLNANGGDTSSSNGETISMPLFCLGGSFPHIDSDEESSDDIKRSETGKLHV